MLFLKLYEYMFFSVRWGIVSFFLQIVGFLYFWGYLGLKGSHFSSEKKNTHTHVYTHTRKARQGHMKHVCKFSESSLKNDVDIRP